MGPVRGGAPSPLVAGTRVTARRPVIELVEGRRDGEAIPTAGAVGETIREPVELRGSAMWERSPTARIGKAVPEAGRPRGTGASVREAKPRRADMSRASTATSCLGTATWPPANASALATVHPCHG